MITGSFASTYHGVTRTTLDIDVVIDPTPANLARLVSLFEEQGFYVSSDHAKTALQFRSQFNAIHMASVWKVDLIICKDRPFSKSEFNRRVPATILGVDTFVASAEDTILAKLEWSKDSGSEKQLRDIEGIIELKAGRLDREYMEKWAKELGVHGTWSGLPWRS